MSSWWLVGCVADCRRRNHPSSSARSRRWRAVPWRAPLARGKRGSGARAGEGGLAVVRDRGCLSKARLTQLALTQPRGGRRGSPGACHLRAAQGSAQGPQFLPCALTFVSRHPREGGVVRPPSSSQPLLRDFFFFAARRAGSLRVTRGGGRLYSSPLPARRGQVLFVGERGARDALRSSPVGASGSLAPLSSRADELAGETRPALCLFRRLLEGRRRLGGVASQQAAGGRRRVLRWLVGGEPRSRRRIGHVVSQ